MIHIRFQVKTRQSQSYKFKKKCQKAQILKFCKKNLQPAHLQKLLDKMYKYEMDPTRTVGVTERTLDAGWTDGQSETNIPPNNFVVRGYNKKKQHAKNKSWMAIYEL